MLNKVMLIGRLGADPEIRYAPSGDQIVSIKLATSMRWKDKQTGERKEETEWHRVTFFRGLAKIAGEYLKKGSQVYIEGRIKTDKYQKDGKDCYSTGIIADQMHMLDSKGAESGNNQPKNTAQATNNAGLGDGADNEFDDDIPF